MTPAQFKAIRKKFFPDDPTAFLIEMGYTGNRSTLKTRMQRYEKGKLEIPGNVKRFAWLLEQWSLMGCQLDPEALPDELPEWPEGV